MRSNPPLTEDLVDQVLPGFAGYGATRFLARIVYSVIVKKKPNLAPHAAALASVIAAAGVWLSVHRIRRLEQYHTPATVGSAIAALQTLLQTYLKKYGWITGDYAPDAIVPGPQLQLPIARTSPTKTITIGGRKYAMPTSPARGSAVDYTQAPLPPPDIGADALSADELDGVSGVAEADLGVFNSQFAVADDDLDQMIAEAANHQIN